MSDPLTVYLQDHLAGSVQAIELVEFLCDQHKGDPLGVFASGLLVEIRADQEVLQRLADRMGGSSSLKELTAWVAEKIARLKLSAKDKHDLGSFQALELLELGIHGKWALWRVLDEISASDWRLHNTDFGHLAARAETQRFQVEQRRLEVGRIALGDERRSAA